MLFLRINEKQVNYQYRNGGTFFGALRTLYADGGIPRFYRGVLPALIQGPMSRFGDTAANTGVLTLLDNIEATKELPVAAKTVCASAAAAGWRIFLMPVDTVKVSKVSHFKEDSTSFFLYLWLTRKFVRIPFLTILLVIPFNFAVTFCSC